MVDDRSAAVKDHVVRTVHAFIRADARQRALELLSRRHRPGSRRWHERSCLVSHCSVLQPNDRVRAALPAIDALVAALGSSGRSECCVIGGQDNELADLQQAITRIINKGWGAFVSVIPGELACYVSELGSDCLVLMPR